MIKIVAYFRTKFDETFDEVLLQSRGKRVGLIYGGKEPLASIVGTLIDLNIKVKSGENAVKMLVQGKELLIKKADIQAVIIFSEEGLETFENLYLVRKEFIKLFKNIVRILQ